MRPPISCWSAITVDRPVYAYDDCERGLSATIVRCGAAIRPAQSSAGPGRLESSRFVGRLAHSQLRLAQTAR